LRRRCELVIGFGPKLLQRVLRSKHSWLAKRCELPRRTYPLAAEAGYADRPNRVASQCGSPGDRPGRCSEIGIETAVRPTITRLQTLRCSSRGVTLDDGFVQDAPSSCALWLGDWKDQLCAS
jgi:hypothetical protein